MMDVKKIEAIVEPKYFDELRERLVRARLAGIRATEIMEYVTSGGPVVVYRGVSQRMNLIPMIKVELICTDAAGETAARIISEHVKPTEPGKEKISFYSVSSINGVRSETVSA
jgi:nitrogen regulatory protein P-II 1